MDLTNPNNLPTEIKKAPVPISPEQQRSLERLDTQVGLHVTTGIEIGKELIHLKSITPHGHFTPLVEWRYGFKKVQQSKYIKIAGSFGDQKFTRVNLSTKALYELSRAPDPEEALLEAQEQGESITVKQAKEIADLHKRVERADEDLAETIKELKWSTRNEKIADKAINLANEARNEIQDKYNKLQEDYEDAVDEGSRKVIRKKQRELDQLKVDLVDQLREEMADAIERKVRGELDGTIESSKKRAEKAEREIERQKQRANGLAEDNLYERSRADKLQADLNAALPVEKDIQHTRSLSLVLLNLENILKKIAYDCEPHQRLQSDIKVREFIEVADAYLGSAPKIIDI